MTKSGHFFAIYMLIFHKTEIQTVILRCSTSLNLNRYNNYDKKCKNTKNGNVCFCTKLQKNGNGNICILSHDFCTNWDLDLLSISKSQISVLLKMNLHMAKKWPERVIKRSFKSDVCFRSVFSCLYSYADHQSIMI